MRAIAVTVRANDVALCDLGQDHRPGPRNDPRDLVLLGCGIAVIELERQNVGLAAVHAGMRAQVFDHSLAIRDAPALKLRKGLALLNSIKGPIYITDDPTDLGKLGGQ